MSTQAQQAVLENGKPITIEGIEYILIGYPMGKTMTIYDKEGTELFTAIEDITGEYMDFYKGEEFILQSPHVGNFEGAEDCCCWFLGSGAGI